MLTQLRRRLTPSSPPASERVEWEAQHPDVTLPPLHLPGVPEGAAAGTNPLAAAQKEVDTKLLRPTNDDSDVKLLKDNSNVEFLVVAGGQ